MAPDVTVESLTLTTADGLSLEAELGRGDAEATALAVVCHPHPLYGGSMHNHVVHRLFTDLPRHGVTTLRFNFRSTGRSEGSHGGGDAESADIVAAIDELTGRHPGLPLILAGYSFGADVSLAVDDGRISAWLAVSPPLRIVDPSTMAPATDPRPTLIVSGTADDFRPAAAAEETTAGWPGVEVRGVEGVDHFWMKGLDELSSAASELVAVVTG